MEKVLSDLFECEFIVLLLAEGRYKVIECYDENDVQTSLRAANKNIFNTAFSPAAIAVIRVVDHRITEWNPILCYSEAKNHVKDFIDETTR